MATCGRTETEEGFLDTFSSCATAGSTGLSLSAAASGVLAHATTLVLELVVWVESGPGVDEEEGLGDARGAKGGVGVVEEDKGVGGSVIVVAVVICEVGIAQELPPAKLLSNLRSHTKPLSIHTVRRHLSYDSQVLSLIIAAASRNTSIVLRLLSKPPSQLGYTTTLTGIQGDISGHPD